MSLNLFCLSPLSSAGCSGFADCLLPLPFLLTFPVDHERDGVELALLREADLYGLYIDSARNERISLPKLHPLCARLPNAVSQAITFSHRRFILRFLEVSTAAGLSTSGRPLIDHVRMEQADQGPHRHLIAPLSTVFLRILQTQHSR